MEQNGSQVSLKLTCAPIQTPPPHIKSMGHDIKTYLKTTIQTENVKRINVYLWTNDMEGLLSVYTGDLQRL